MTCASAFHVGNLIYIAGYTSSISRTSCIYNNDVKTWYNRSTFAKKISYTSNQTWIGPDGYAYIFGTNADVANAAICYKSGRKKIYVTEPANENGLYTHRKAVTETGVETSYTIHCQMGMAPWLTNRRDPF